MRSTISLFKRFFDNIPPIFPDELKTRIGATLEGALRGELSLSEIENEMIRYGYEVWPWSEAYHEIYRASENRMAEHFFLPKISKDAQAKYEKFKHYGGDFGSVNSGRAAGFFSLEERQDIARALLEVKKEMHRFVDNEVVGTARKIYLRKVEEFSKILLEIRSTLETLKQIAEREDEHPALAKEIRSRVESFEHGLCCLGQKLDKEAVKSSVDHFAGRKEDLKRLSAVLVIK